MKTDPLDVSFTCRCGRTLDQRISEMSAAINAELQQLDLATLLDLIFDLSSVEQLETWIGSKLPQKGRNVAA